MHLYFRHGYVKNIQRILPQRSPECFTMLYPSITYAGVRTNWLLTPDMPNSIWLPHIKCIDYIGYRRKKQVKTSLLNLVRTTNPGCIVPFLVHICRTNGKNTIYWLLPSFPKPELHRSTVNPGKKWQNQFLVYKSLCDSASFFFGGGFFHPKPPTSYRLAFLRPLKFPGWRQGWHFCSTKRQNLPTTWCLSLAELCPRHIFLIFSVGN